MRLEAHFTSEDLREALLQLTPLALSLDPGSPHRQLSLKPPSEVKLVAGEGLRIVTELTLQWDVIGLRVPVTLRRVSILLNPRVQAIDGRAALLFGLRIEEADLSAIPAFLHDVVIARVNEALERSDDRIAWRFMETLDFRFFLPPEVLPRTEMRIWARAGDVRIDAGSLCLGVEWGLAATAEHRESVGP
jgi:hypothetical protein